MEVTNAMKILKLITEQMTVFTGKHPYTSMLPTVGTSIRSHKTGNSMFLVINAENRYTHNAGVDS